MTRLMNILTILGILLIILAVIAGILALIINVLGIYTLVLIPIGLVFTGINSMLDDLGVKDHIVKLIWKSWKDKK